MVLNLSAASPLQRDLTYPKAMPSGIQGCADVVLLSGNEKEKSFCRNAKAFLAAGVTRWCA
ncbi:MAG: hypothetical protein NC192_01905 [Muribaculaceae bacterium]|nr:hypothetical protein [Muribaculaceae bacterium]